MKFGIIGLGNHAVKRVMPAIRMSHNQILSIYSRSKKKAEDQAILYGSETYDNLKEVLASDVDAFYIASPNALHFDHARLALENGKHVLLEKPMTLRYSDATDLTRLAEKEDLALGVGFHLRLHPAIEEIKNAIDAGVIGNITLIEAAWTGFSGGAKRTGDSSWWEDPEMVGGGSIMGTGVHVMDCLNNIMRSYPDRISSIRFPHGDIIDITSSINLQYGATIAHAVSSRNVFLPENWVSEEKSAVIEAINYLSNESDVIIAEGSGSPAEINMFDRDIANTFLLENFDLAGILVADIEKGGVYASIAGTISLMKHSEKVRWIAINKMHGDVSLIESANREIYNITGKPVIGTIPFSKYSLPGEDMMDYLTEDRKSPEILLIKYPHWENYSDIDSLSYYAGITYITSPIRTLFENCSLIILPGSKNVLEDLKFLRSVGLDKLIIEFSESKKIIGICGGYQILGRIIRGPAGTEVEDTQVNGLGLLECQTTYEKKKTVKPVTYRFHQSTGIFSDGNGYEIHYGTVTTAESPLLDVNGELEGSVSRRGNIFGTNVHGILENREFLSYLLSRKLTGNYSDHIEEQIELLSRNVRNSLDLSGLISYARSGQIP